MLKKLKQCDGNDEIIKAVCGDENTEVGGWWAGWENTCNNRALIFVVGLTMNDQ